MISLELCVCRRADHRGRRSAILIVSYKGRKRYQYDLLLLVLTLVTWLRFLQISPLDIYSFFSLSVLCSLEGSHCAQYTF